MKQTLLLATNHFTFISIYSINNLFLRWNVGACAETGCRLETKSLRKRFNSRFAEGKQYLRILISVSRKEFDILQKIDSYYVLLMSRHENDLFFFNFSSRFSMIRVSQFRSTNFSKLYSRFGRNFEQFANSPFT